MRTIDDVLTRLRAEFLEMPGLRLTCAQAQRLCGVEQTVCQMMLNSLVAAKFLGVSTDGRYARVTDETMFPSGAVKADLRTDQRFKTAS